MSSSSHWQIQHVPPGIDVSAACLASEAIAIASSCADAHVLHRRFPGCFFSCDFAYPDLGKSSLHPQQTTMFSLYKCSLYFNLVCAVDYRHCFGTKESLTYVSPSSRRQIAIASMMDEWVGACRYSHVAVGINKFDKRAYIMNFLTYF